MVLTAMGVVIGTLGPGQWSIDGHVSALQNLWGWPGFGIALGAGGLGALALLGVYWRPDKPDAGGRRPLESSVPAAVEQEARRPASAGGNESVIPELT